MSVALKNRLETRKNCFVPVESQSNPTFDKTQTVDISRHGIGFISSHPHEINEKVAVGIQLKPNTDPVLVVGFVKWVHKIPDSEQYRIGLYYDEGITGPQGRLDSYFEKSDYLTKWFSDTYG